MIVFWFLLLVLCALIVSRMCTIFESCTNYLGRNMSEGVKGATLNAIGSSMPELLTTVFFLIFASQENLARDLGASIGGDTGSAIFNTIVIPTIVIGLVLSIGVKRIRVSKKVVLRDGLFLLFAEVILLVLLSSSYITHWHGWVLTVIYLVYLSYTFLTMKRVPPKPYDINAHRTSEKWHHQLLFNKENGVAFRCWLLLTLVTLIIAGACAGLVEACKEIALFFSINPFFIALTLIAAASSLPDTILSMKDARKGNYDDALSNVLGSNIFDITISMGLPLALFLLITGQRIEFAEAGTLLIDIRVVLLLTTIIAVAIYYFNHGMRAIQMYMLGGLYLAFLLYAIGAASHQIGADNWLSQFTGQFVQWLQQPGGIDEMLRDVADKLTGNW